MTRKRARSIFVDGACREGMCSEPYAAARVLLTSSRRPPSRLVQILGLFLLFLVFAGWWMADYEWTEQVHRQSKALASGGPTEEAIGLHTSGKWRGQTERPKWQPGLLRDAKRPMRMDWLGPVLF